MNNSVDYGLFFLNEEKGYTQKEIIRLAELARIQIGQTVKGIYGIEKVVYDIKTEKTQPENGETRYKSVKIVTNVPNKIENQAQGLENILKRMDTIAPLVESEKLVDDVEKSHYIVFNGIGFLGGPFYNNDSEQMKYTMSEGIKLGFKEPLIYPKNNVKKKLVLSYQSALSKPA